MYSSVNSSFFVFKGSSGHGRPLSSLEHNQLPFLFLEGPQTPVQTYQMRDTQSEWDNLFLQLSQFSFANSNFSTRDVIDNNKNDNNNNNNNNIYNAQIS